jgi:hypothetical protein
MSGIVPDLVEKFRALWYECELTLPNLGKTYSLSEKREREALFHRYLSVLDSHTAFWPRLLILPARPWTSKNVRSP